MLHLVKDPEDHNIIVLFTTSRYPTSWLIRKITKEPASHVAFLKDGLVLHSNFKGVNTIPLVEFLKTNRVVCALSGMQTERSFNRIVCKYWKTKYDFLALLYLAFRYILPKKWTKKANLWETSALFLCTEFVTSEIEGKADSLITPYQLFLRYKHRLDSNRSSNV